MTEEKKIPPSSKSWLAAEMWFGFFLWGTVFLVVLSFGPKAHWTLTLTRCFYLQYFVVSIMCLLYYGIRRHKKFALGINFVLFSFLCTQVVPWYSGKDNIPLNTPTLKLFLCNVLYVNQHHDRVLKLIEEENPDIVVIQEMTREWQTSLGVLKTTYPFFIERARSDSFGMGFYSKRKVKNLEIFNFPRNKVPSISCTLENGTKFLATHPVPPRSRDYSANRNNQLEEIKRWVQFHPNCLVLGDLNATPWDPYLEDLMHATGLKNSRQGFGLLPSWPSGSRLLQIPIDHCLVNSSLLVKDTRVGPHVGSDHLPLIVEVAFPEG